MRVDPPKLGVSAHLKDAAGNFLALPSGEDTVRRHYGDAGEQVLSRPLSLSAYVNIGDL